MLPRPARVVRQGLFLHNHVGRDRNVQIASLRCSTSTASIHAQKKERIKGKTKAGIRDAASPELDESFKQLIADYDMSMGMGMSDVNSFPFGSMPMEDIELVEKSTHDDGNVGVFIAENGTIDDELRHERVNENVQYEQEGREERRSPAAVIGSKRVGSVVLPDELKKGIQDQIDQLEDPRQLRSSYLSLPHHKQREEKLNHRSSRTSGTGTGTRRTTQGELAKAAAVLPGEYAAVRNIFQELEKRLGPGWLGNGTNGEVVEFSGGLGSAMWSALDTLDQFPSSSADTPKEDMRIQLVHSSRHSLDLATKIAEGIPNRATVQLSFNRKYVPTSTPPAAILSTFLLSTLPTRPSQQTHLLQLLSLDSPYIILVDRHTPEGWDAISAARSFLLEQSTSETPLHIVAPCPHDKTCPLLGTRDTCSFSQRLQRPSFLRKTKHASRGEEDIGYCYLVLARGKRPYLPIFIDEAASSMAQALKTAGRVGGVGREAAERAVVRTDGRGVLTEIEGAEGVLEVVHLQTQDQEDQSTNTTRNFDQAEMVSSLRKEAYEWPRMVAPPMKRSGHVTLDACCPDGNIQRLTFSKSHSKQGYHDARKSSWGDLFPHESKATPVIRTRGVRRLTRPEKTDDQQGAAIINELLAGDQEDASDVLKELEKMGIVPPKAEIVKDTYKEDVTVWRSETKGPFGSDGQRRGLMTSVQRKPCMSLLGPLGQTQIRKMSARPSNSRSKMTISELNRLFQSKTPITCLTAYDYPTGLLCEQTGVDMVLIGDSLSQVSLGHDSTTCITLEEMIHHSKAVTKACKSAFTFADMPFGSFETSLEQGVSNVIIMIKEGGVDGVKIEGGREILPLVKRLSEIGIPVIPHLGLQPQRATSLSGYLVQARKAEDAFDLLKLAKEMKDAGATALLLEAIPHMVAKKVTDHVGLLTIGIGAGNGTSGQVLVITDVLGTYAEDPEKIESDIQVNSTSDGAFYPSLPSSTGSSSSTPISSLDSSTITSVIPPKSSSSPRFVRQFGALGPYAREAIRRYLTAVRDGSFPNEKESYGMKKLEYEGFLKLVEDDVRK